ncbi:helix-turn-helix domain-containing protein [Mycobacteroides abscessus]|uniref:helix-turn-helix domain-containing protein n=1 Tax=Mycobacteroides abscessus TaxID=36809 RepID=UPI0009A8F087|nr:helix-turn-helix domain-containing protein [Mycobacteroides abscessus]SLH40867.1 ESX-1 secretion-associated regulator EspR [Mycobacteroides abscessus subsp. massiliense]
MDNNEPAAPAGGEEKNSYLAQKLNKLFDMKHKANAAPLSNDAAAKEIFDMTNVKISGSYLWLLRQGERDNPTLQHLQAIAEYFGVPAAYLVEPGVDENLEAQVETLMALRDAGVRDLATRAFGVSKSGLQSLSQMADHVRKLEDLPPVGGDASDGNSARAHTG